MFVKMKNNLSYFTLVALSLLNYIKYAFIVLFDINPFVLL